MAADVDQAGTPPGQYTMGYIAVDSEGNVVASHSERTRLEPLEGRANASLSYLDSVAVDPGVYDVRLAVVDAQGRHGSVVRDAGTGRRAAAGIGRRAGTVVGLVLGAGKFGSKGDKKT